MTTDSPAYSRQFGADDARAIRDAVKKDLGPAAFKSRPLRALWFIPMTAIIVGSITSILAFDLPWWGNLLLSLLAGHTLACQALLAHEVLHGALGMSKDNSRLPHQGRFNTRMAAMLPMMTILRGMNHSARRGRALKASGPRSFFTASRIARASSAPNWRL